VASEVRLGIFAKTFARPSPEGVEDALAGHDLSETLTRGRGYEAALSVAKLV
jgi:hypothetical protein